MINNNACIHHYNIKRCHFIMQHMQTTTSHRSKCRSTRPKTYPKMRVIFLTRNKLWAFRMNRGQSFSCALTGLRHPVIEPFHFLASLPLIPNEHHQLPQNPHHTDTARGGRGSWVFQTSIKLNLYKNLVYRGKNIFCTWKSPDFSFFLRWTYSTSCSSVCIIYAFHMFLSVSMTKCWWSRCLEEF